MEYSIWFGDIKEEVIESKIDEIIENGEYPKDALTDYDTREKVRKQIASHFPIYLRMYNSFPFNQQ